MKQCTLATYGSGAYLCKTLVVKRVEGRLTLYLPTSSIGSDLGKVLTRSNVCLAEALSEQIPHSAA